MRCLADLTGVSQSLTSKQGD